MSLRGVFFALLSLAVLGAGAALAAEPVIPKAQGSQCVEETQFMRRNHMTLLKHQRDATMHQGIRSKAHSLRECLTCHAVPDAKGQPVSVASPDHFCNACHGYAAVQVDCFDCHASR
jgi:hypothetical protein